jgi:hypothetical protein
MEELKFKGTPGPNAQLIAAAPEMIKKIQELRAFIDDISPSCAAGDDQLSFLKSTTDSLINKALSINH